MATTEFPKSTKFPETMEIINANYKNSIGGDAKARLAFKQVARGVHAIVQARKKDFAIIFEPREMKDQLKREINHSAYPSVQKNMMKKFIDEMPRNPLSVMWTAEWMDLPRPD